MENTSTRFPLLASFAATGAAQDELRQHSQPKGRSSERHHKSKKKRRIMVYCDAATYDMIRSNAKTAALSLSSYLVRAGMNGTKPIPLIPPKEIDLLLGIRAQLGRLGGLYKRSIQELRHNVREIIEVRNSLRLLEERMANLDRALARILYQEQRGTRIQRKLSPELLINYNPTHQAMRPIT